MFTSDTRPEHFTRVRNVEKVSSYNTERKAVRANVTIGQTFGGNSSKINSAHIIKLGRPQCETNHCIVCLAKYRFIFEKIDNNQIL